MYVRLKSYEANSFSDHVLPYRCVHCGHATTARAFAFATGVGISPYGLDDQGAAARADRHARANAAAQAALSIRIAPCPRCHRRNRQAILEVYRSSLLLSLAILVTPILLVAGSGQRWQAALFVGGALGVVPAMLFWKHRTSQLTSRQVRFDPPPDPLVKQAE